MNNLKNGIAKNCLTNYSIVKMERRQFLSLTSFHLGLSSVKKTVKIVENKQ